MQKNECLRVIYLFDTFQQNLRNFTSLITILLASDLILQGQLQRYSLRINRPSPELIQPTTNIGNLDTINPTIHYSSTTS